MAERIKVSTEEMRETANRYMSAKSNLEQAYSNMDKAIRVLDTAWRGAAYVAMRTQWNMTYRNIQQASERMQDAVDELNRSADLFDENNAQQISAFQALDVGTSPFD